MALELTVGNFGHFSSHCITAVFGFAMLIDPVLVSKQMIGLNKMDK